MTATATKMAKKQQIYISKKATTTTTHHAFLYISLHDCNMKRTYFTRPL